MLKAPLRSAMAPVMMVESAALRRTIDAPARGSFVAASMIVPETVPCGPWPGAPPGPPGPPRRCAWASEEIAASAIAVATARGAVLFISRENATEKYLHFFGVEGPA